MNVEGRLNKPFVGVPTFLRAPLVLDESEIDADIAVVGVPTDEGSPFIPGSRFAPRSIREQSLRFADTGQPIYDPSTDRLLLGPELANGRIVDTGDADILPTDQLTTFDNVTAKIRTILDAGALPVVLGGDHAISYPVVRAYEQPVHVVQFDAHLDYAPFSHGLRYTNGHPFRHIAHLEKVTSLTQVGIRSLRTGSVAHADTREDGNRVITTVELRGLDPENTFSAIPADSATYVSIDIDVLDIALVPGCVSAEPAGISYEELRDLLRQLARRLKVVGLDLVEVNPLLDVATGVTSFLAAHLLVEFVGEICEQPRWRKMNQ